MQTIALSCCPIAHKLLSDWYQSDTLPVFCTGKAVLAIKWGISAMKWGIFALYAPSSARLHAFYLHLTLFACTALIFNALRRVGYSAQSLHTFALPARRLFTPCTGCFFDNNEQQKRLRQVELPVGTTDISTYCKRYNALAQVPICWVQISAVQAVQGGAGCT